MPFDTNVITGQPLATIRAPGITPVDPAIVQNIKTPVPIDENLAQQNAYKMAQNQMIHIQQVQQFNDQQRDRAILTAAQNGGADFHSVQGIQAFLNSSSAKGLSQTSLNALIKRSEMIAQAQAQAANLMAQQGQIKINALTRNTNSFINDVAPLVKAYNKDISRGTPQGEALATFQAKRDALVKQYSSTIDPVTGQPELAGAALQQFAAADPVTMWQHVLSNNAYVKGVLLPAAQIAKEQAQTTMLSEGKVTGTYTDPTGNIYTMKGGRLFKTNIDGSLSLVTDPNIVKGLTKPGATTSPPMPALTGDQRKLHGQDFLNTLPSDTANLIQGLDEGRVDIRALPYRGSEREEFLRYVAQYNPNFDLTKAQARQKTRNDFTGGGPTARKITQLNQAIGHLGTLQQLTDALNNHDVQAANTFVNTLKTETGDPSVVDFNTARLAVGNELMTLFRTTGANEEEAKAWQKIFNSSSSPSQLRGSMQTAGHLLMSRISSLNNQWKRGMETSSNFPGLLDPEAISVLKTLGMPVTAELSPSVKMPSKIKSVGKYTSIEQVAKDPTLSYQEKLQIVKQMTGEQ